MMSRYRKTSLSLSRQIGATLREWEQGSLDRRVLLRRAAALGLSALSQPWGQGLRQLAVPLRSPPGPFGIYTVDGRMVPMEAAAFCDALEGLCRGA